MRGEGGYTMMEMVVVLAILGVVVGGIVTLFAAGLNADADQTRRYRAQEDGRLALNQVRRDVHSACAVSNPSTYNTWLSTLTLYSSQDSCAAGSHSVSYCTSGSGNVWTLTRVLASTCSGSSTILTKYLTTNLVFAYLPPNSHVTTLGGGSTGIVTQDGSSTLGRVHVDLQINQQPSKSLDRYHLVDDVVLRNGIRACGVGVASC